MRVLLAALDKKTAPHQASTSIVECSGRKWTYKQRVINYVIPLGEFFLERTKLEVQLGRIQCLSLLLRLEIIKPPLLLTHTQRLLITHLPQA